MDIVQARLHSQQLVRHTLADPSLVVEWFGAVQSQDYAGAKWGLGQRVPGATDANIDRAFNSGAILRTHVLRPTWHFVSPADIRWMLALTAPRVHALNAYMYRRLELDDTLLSRSNAALVKSLEGGNHLTRPELMSALSREGIYSHDPLRGSYIMMHAELEALVCSGPRRGKQFTYALLDEQAPRTPVLKREEALAELVWRYFRSHGPATAHDFVWWSGLTAADAKAGLDANKQRLLHETINRQIYWFPELGPTMPPSKDTSHTAYLLPNYDEYISYKDRSAMFNTANADKMDPKRGTVFPHIIIIDGVMMGTWKRTLARSEVVIETSLFSPLNEGQALALKEAAERYGRFLDLAPRLHPGSHM